MEDMISVIIPTYNREKLIVKSIKSVLSQTYKNIEVIVVDDNSTDKTEFKIKKIRDKRLKYIKLRKNHGACYARNIGISKAQGKYVAFQDSDDLFLKNKLEVQLNNMKKNGSDMDFCKLHVITDGHICEFPNEEQIKKIRSSNILDLLCCGNIISTQAIVVKRDVLATIKFDESLPRFQDYDLVLRIAHDYKISYTNTVLGEVYRQCDSISNSDEKLKAACLNMLKKDYYLSKKQNEVFENTLIYWLTKNDIDNRLLLENKYNKIKNDYDRLKDCFDILNVKYNDVNNRYKDLINSKRIKYLSKLLCIFKK